MELPDFIDQLEQAISNAGSDKLWKRMVGDLEIWFSPMTLPASQKVNEVLVRTDLGPNVVIESKRVTLSHSIVGMGKIDLRPYRNGQAVFPIVNKEGKTVKVPLEKYVYEKMSTWGGQYVDDVFMVYADLLETHQKENLKDVRFENAKEPKHELLDLEARTAELRHQLGMPKMVEEGSTAATPSDETEEAETGDEKTPVDVPNPDFNPFKTQRSDGLPAHVEAAEAAMQHPTSPIRRSSQDQPVVVQRPDPKPVTASIPDLLVPTTPEDELFQTTPKVVQPPVSIPLLPVRAEEILEERATRQQVPPPQIDRPVGNVNPRFARPTR